MTWLRALAVAIVLVGVVGVAVDQAPPTTWAAPVAAGPLVDGWAVYSLRRSDTEVRLDLGPDRDHLQTVVLQDARVPGPALARTARVAVVRATGPPLPAGVRDHLVAHVTAWEATWPRRPAFVAPPATRTLPRQTAEIVALHLCLVFGLAGLVLTAPGWSRALARVRTPTWAVVAAAALLPVVLPAWAGWWGPWHSNLHGLDRVADVVRGAAPHAANLGLLHGLGYYAWMQPLHALTGAPVPALTSATAGLLVLATFVWTRLLWRRDAPAAWAAVVLGSSAVLLRLAGSASMYVPATLFAVLALAAFELHLRDDRVRWLGLGLLASLVAMQTRAELLVLLPAWAAGAMLLRRPSWLRTAWRRPGVLGALALAVVAIGPRALALLATPPPGDLRRAALDPFADPRLAVLAALAATSVAVLPALRPWRRRLGGPWGVAALGGVAAVTYILLLWTRGGPLERTWQLHAFLDPGITAPWLPAIALAGAAVAAWGGARRVGWIGVALALTWWVHVPQYDCLSTYVRTGLLTMPWLAALAGVGLAWLPGVGGQLLGVALVAAGLAWSVPWLDTVYPKQQLADLLVEVRRRVPEQATLVWLSEGDVPPEVRASGVHSARLALGHVLGPGVRVAPLSDWARGALAEAGPVVFVHTPDCHRVLLEPGGTRAWAGDRWVRWRYVDRSDVATAPRIRVDGLPDDWLHPACAAARAAGGAPLWSMPLARPIAGSIYETLVGGPPEIAVVPLPSAPP